jgi:ABC-type polysaccharide/polyol phosphate export permease
MLVAVQIRLTITYGAPLYPSYQAHSPALYVLMITSAILSFGLTSLLKRRSGAAISQWQFYDLLFGIGVSCIAIALLMPQLSILQLVYYAVIAILLGGAVILLPARFLKKRPLNVSTSLTYLWDNRYLLRMWIANNVRARYTQTTLGIAWIVLLPLAQALILAFVFSRFMRMDVGDVPYVSFFFAALVPWSFFNSSTINATGAITGMMGLINQIYFPREILVLVKLGESIVDILFMFGALILINALAGLAPTIHYLYLPILFAITVALTLGVAFFLSYFAVLVRDIPQLLFVILQLLFYLTPVIYPSSFIPVEFRSLMLLNPLVPLVQAYRDVIAYQRPPDLISLHYPFVISILLLYLGYGFFKANERRLADFV